MFGQLGFGEILMIMVVILLLFGAKRIPEVAASFGKGIKEFKKNINDVTHEVTTPPRADTLQPPRATDSAPVAADEARPEPRRLI
jgi:sec-independent protein translocase protein TatA